jgi:excisionase family DNA binding protein
MSTKEGAARQTLTIEEAAALLGIGRNSAYQAVASGQLPVIRIGRRLLVPRAALQRLLADAPPSAGTLPDGRRA